MSLSSGEIENLDKSTHSYEKGQTVPILEHLGCSGLNGTVQEDGSITCDKCGKIVMPDNQAFIERRRLIRR